MKKYLEYMMNEIESLTKIPSPSGYTEKVMDYIEEQLKKMKVDYRKTKKGALIATVSGKIKEQERTISAHVDTLGAMVKGIKENGRIYFEKIGGYMLQSIEGENCMIETVEGKQFSGTILSIKPSVHIHSDAGQLERKLENMEIILDENILTKEEVKRLGIDVGDFIFFDPRTKRTDSGYIKSRHLDDKASVGILIGILKYITDHQIVPEYKTNFFFSNYEEVGHGASAAIPSNTFEFLAVDMGAPGEGQNSSEQAVCICAKDSSGPYDYDFRRRLVKLCKDKEIHYRVDLYPYYGSDASAALRAGYDFKTALVGPGVFASHGYERTHEEGVLNTAKLIKEYIKSK